MNCVLLERERERERERDREREERESCNAETGVTLITYNIIIFDCRMYLCTALKIS